MDIRRTACYLAIRFALAALTCGAQTAPARDIAQSSEATQREWIESELNRGVLIPTDTLGTLVLTKSQIAIPLIEKKIEEVLRSSSPADCFSDKSVDPNKFVELAGGLIAYAANQDTMTALDRLVKIDAERFAPSSHPHSGDRTAREKLPHWLTAAWISATQQSAVELSNGLSRF